MKILHTILLSAVILTCFSCKKERLTGSGPVITQSRPLNNFTKIYTGGATDVYVTQGPAFSVEVNGYGNLVPFFETKVVNNTLELGYREKTTVKNDNVKVFVTMPVLNALTTAGSGNIHTSGNFTNNPFFGNNITGSGNIYFALGTAQHYRTVISGSGSVYAFGMQADNADITISGSGQQEISASATLKVNIAGSGNVYYKGSPVITARISGSGALIPR